VAAIALAANIANRALPFRPRFASNLVAAGAATVIGHRAGVSWRELGLGRDHLADGVRWGASVGALVALAVVAAGTPPQTRRRFVDERVRAHGPGRVAYELGARIPFETAFAEELVFRGALLGIAMRRRSPVAAVTTTSVLFGFWHALPTWDGMDGSAVGSAIGERKVARLGAVAGVVGATAAAGAGFAALRLRSGSVVAPMVVHAALNMTTFSLARFAAR
jgi:membrane protease YdiL (CAAX protease family)